MNWKNLWPLVLIPFIAFLTGWAERATGVPVDATGEVTGVAAALIFTLLLLWCWRDARERQYRLSWGLCIAMVLVTTVAVPWYLVRSRHGVVHRVKAVLGLLGAFVLTMACYCLGAGA